MDLGILAKNVAEIDRLWPNGTDVVEKHFIRPTPIMMFLTEDLNNLQVLLERLPAMWSEAKQMSFREWFDLPETDKAQYQEVALILTVSDHGGKIPLLPSSAPFLAYSTIIDCKGVFKDARDLNGYRWGDASQGITSNSVLNPTNENQ